MPRKLLLFAALAVIGSMLVLWLIMRGGSSASPRTAPDDGEPIADRGTRGSRERIAPALGGGAQDPATGPTDTQRPVPDPNPKSSDPSRPHASTITPMERGSAPVDEPLVYTLPDGRIVRDHRPPEMRKPLDIPPSTQAPGGRRITPDLTGLFSSAIIEHMKECGKAIPQVVRGAKPRLEGQIVIAIKSEQGTVTSAVFKVTDVNSDAVAASTKECVEQKALTVRVPATGEQDLDSYSINLSLALI